MAKYIVLDGVPSEDVKKNLALDAGGEIVDVNALGLVIECKRRIGRALDMMELVNVEEVVQYA